MGLAVDVDAAAGSPAVSAPPEGPVPARTPAGRHPGDLVRVLTGVMVLVLAALVVQKDKLSTFERDAFLLVNNLPGLFSPLLLAVMQMGNAVAGPAVAAGALAARRRRLSLELACAGPIAWVAAKVVKDMVDRPRPSGFLDGLLRHEGGEGLGFVSGHTAVAAALATVAAAHLPRRWARAAWALAWSVGFARVYMGAHLPLDIVGGAAVGWSIGAAIHLLAGAPRRTISTRALRRVMAGGGVPVVAFEAAPVKARGSFPFLARLADGSQLFVKVVDPETRDHDLSFRMARFLAVRDLRDEVALSDPKAQAEHEAALALLARQAGCRTPAIHRVQAAEGRAWLVQDLVPGHRLDHLEAARDEHVLAEVWRQVVMLHRSDLAHRDLVTSNIMIDPAGAPWLVDFAHAQSGPPPRALDNDVAELLASSAVLAGPAVAASAAASVLDPDVLARAVPELQPLALTAATRRQLRDRPDLLRALRAEVAARAGLATVPTKGAPPVLPVGAALRALFHVAAGVLGLALLAGPGAVSEAVSSANARWVGGAICFAVVSFVTGAAAFAAATDRRLGLGRTTLVHAFAGGAALVPDGDRAIRERYLHRAGVPPAEAVAAFRRFRMAWRGAALVLGSVAGLAATVEGADWRRPAHLVPGLVLAAVLAGSAGLWPRPTSPAACPGRVHLLPRPLAATVLVATALLAAVANAGVLAAAAAAFGGGVPIAALSLVAVLFGLLAGARPLRGAPGAGEVLLALTLNAAGMPVAGAVGAALLARKLWAWTPLVAGALLVRRLERRLVL